MKTKLCAALIALIGVVGLVCNSSNAVAETTCKGTGALCGTSSDGTSYWKADNVELENF